MQSVSFQVFYRIRSCDVVFRAFLSAQKREKNCLFIYFFFRHWKGSDNEATCLSPCLMRLLRNGLVQCQPLVQLSMLTPDPIVGHSWVTKSHCHFCLWICAIFVAMMMTMLLLWMLPCRHYRMCPYQIRHFSAKTKETFVENISISFSWLLLRSIFGCSTVCSVLDEIADWIMFVDDSQFVFVNFFVACHALLYSNRSKI